MARRRSPDLEFEAALRERLGAKKYRRLQLLLKWTRQAIQELEGLELPRGRRTRGQPDPLSGLSTDLRSTLSSLIDRLQGAADENGHDQPPAAAAAQTRRRSHLRVVARSAKRQ